MATVDRKQFIEEGIAAGKSKAQIYDELVKLGALGIKPIAEKRGFVQEIPATIGQIGGGIIGGVLGAGAGGIGAIPGAITGATLGGAAGEVVQQRIEKISGERRVSDLGPIVEAGITGGLFEIGGAGIGAGLQIARPVLVKWLGKLSGFTDEIVGKALERTPGLKIALEKGEVALKELVDRSSKKIAELGRTMLKESQTAINNFSKVLSLGGPGKVASRKLVLDEANNFSKATINYLNTTHKIGVENGTRLVFDRPNVPSRIITPGDQKAIQETFTLLNSIKNNTSIKHIDAIFERMIALRSKTPIGSVTGPETKAIIGEMMNQTLSFVKKTYPPYHKFLAENLPKRIMLKEAKELFGGAERLTPKEADQVIRRLQQLYNSGRIAERQGAEIVGGRIGEDITGTVAGEILQRGDVFSTKATQLTTRGILEKAINFLPRAAITGFAKTGKLSGELTSHPVINLIAQITGKSVRFVVQDVVNFLEGKEIQ